MGALWASDMRLLCILRCSGALCIMHHTCLIHWLAIWIISAACELVYCRRTMRQVFIEAARHACTYTWCSSC